MPVIEKGAVRINYQDAGSGPPLLVLPGGGLNATIAGLATHPFNPMTDFTDAWRCISLDMRNAPGGSSGPVEADRSWDSHADDQLALMDHLGIDRFLVLGFCIGGPLIWNLLRRAPDRIIAGVMVQPSGFRAEVPDLFYRTNMAGWGPALCARRPEITMAQFEPFLRHMYLSNPDFVFTVTRDFARACQTPLLVLPDDIPVHPYEVAMEAAMLAPNGQASFYPWKHPKERIPMAVRHIRAFLKANI